MAGSEYYDHTTYPSTGAHGSSSAMRSELDLIEAGFGKLPDLSGNNNKAVVINAGGTGMSVTTGTLALAGNFATAGAYPITLTATGSTGVTLPTTGTLATLDGTEILSNKTLVAPSLGTPASGVLTNCTGTAANLTAGKATTLATARTIDGQSFDGSGNITVVAPAINGASAKATPVDADKFGLADSAASWVLKYTTLANLKSVLKTYNDTLYGNVTGQASSVDSEIALFSGTTGKLIKRASTTGMLKAASGVLSAASAGTDYVAPGAATGSGLTMTTARLLGRSAAGTGSIEELTIGTGLVLSAGHLSASYIAPTFTAPTSVSGTTKFEATAIPTNSSEILFHFYVLSTNGTSPLVVKIGASPGNGGYGGSYYGAAGGTTTVVIASVVNSGAYIPITPAIVAAGTYSGFVRVSLVDPTNMVWAVVANVVRTDSGAVFSASGTIDLGAGFAGVIDRAMLTTVNGTDQFDSGVARIGYS